MSKVKLSVFRNDQLVDSHEFQVIEGVEQEIIIGRASDCHISLADHQVSRHHVSLTYSSGILSLKNLSQYQNVYVNGKNVNNALVSDSDSIQFYDYTLKIQGATGIQDIIPDDIDSLLNEVEKTQMMSSQNPVQETVVMSEEDLQESLDKETYQEDEPLEDEIDNDDRTNLRESKPLIEGNDDIKSITQRIQNILSSSEDDNSDEFQIDETEFEDEEEETPEASEVLEFGDDQGFGGEVQTLSEETGLIDKFAQIYLSISGEDVPYHKYILESKETIVGSSRKSCDIVLEDNLVSEIHARFLYDKKRVWVEDMGSENGTYVNGEKVNKIELNQGDEILIGAISFVLMVGSEILSEEAKRLMPIASEQEMIEHQLVGDQEEAELYSNNAGLGNLPEGASIKVRFERMMANPQQKRMFYYVVLILFVLILFDEDDDTANVARKETKAKTTVERPADQAVEQKPTQRSQEELEYLESHYQLAKAKLEEGDYDGALLEVEYVRTVDPNYKNIDSLSGVAKQGLVALEEAERKKKEEQERLEVERKIRALLTKAEDAMKDEKLVLAETYLNEIAQFDPENSNLYSLKLEIDAAKKEQERLRKEQEEREKRRSEFLSALAPAKSLFAQGEWYKASKMIDKVITMKGIEAELLNDANDILKQAQEKIQEETERLLTEARGYRQGEDLKNAYETYLKLLKINPVSGEALTELGEIQSNLDGRAKLVYREALVSESISLFDDAKEKYLEVLQIAPSESDYYKKAKAKLEEFYVE